MKKINNILNLKYNKITFHYKETELKLNIKPGTKPINSLHDINKYNKIIAY
jgi:hypothetical protein